MSTFQRYPCDSQARTPTRDAHVDTCTLLAADARTLTSVGAHRREQARYVHTFACTPSKQAHQRLPDAMRMSPSGPRAPKLLNIQPPVTRALAQATTHLSASGSLVQPKMTCISTKSIATCSKESPPAPLSTLSEVPWYSLPTGHECGERKSLSAQASAGRALACGRLWSRIAAARRRCRPCAGEDHWARRCLSATASSASSGSRQRHGPSG